MKSHLFTFFFIFFSVFLFGQNKNPIPVLQNLAGSDQLIGDSCTNSVQIGTNAYYCTYSWTPSIGLSDSTIAMPTVCPTQTTTYVLYVTDNDGNAYRDSVTVSVAKISSQLFRPLVLGGTKIDDDSIFTKGAMTFENLDNDDKDTKFDNSDDKVEGGDNELVPWVVQIESQDINKIFIEAIKGRAFVKIWTTSTKENGTEYVIDANTDRGATIELSQVSTGLYRDTFWIEGIDAHNSPRATELIVKFADLDDINVDPITSIFSSQISLTILGISEITWIGRSNGYNSDVGNYNNDQLDHDLNYYDPQYNKDLVAGLESYRVFPGKRLKGTKLDKHPRNRVDIEVEFTTEPIENFDLYLKSFDIDDPFEDPVISNENPKFFVDPNDKTNIAGIYDGCSVIANDTSRNGYAEYDKDNDNRGMAEAGVSIFPNLNINGKPTTSKTGIFLEDIPSQKTKIVSSSNSIAKVRISKNKKSIKVGFVVSRQPGDNYRIVANVDNNFLENLRNEDQHDKLRIVDKNVASATGKTGVLESWENYTSNILTIWRILHYESDEMEDGFSFDTNSEVITITNFSGSIASNCNTINTFDNVQGVSDISVFPGRFENGDLRIGILPSGLSSNDVTVSLRSNSTIASNHNKSIVSSSNFNLIQGMNGIQTLPVKLETTIGSSTIIIEGIIDEITKVGSNYEYQIIPNVGMPSLSNSFVGGVIKIAGYTDDNVVITTVDAVALTVTSNILRIPAFIADDDLNSSYSSASINWDTINRIYRKVFLELDELIDYSNDNVDRKINLTSHASFDIGKKFPPSSLATSSNDSYEDFWFIHALKAFQSKKLRDAEPDKKETSRLGITSGVAHNFNLARGSNYSIAYEETIRDALNQYAFPATGINISSQLSWTIAHEIGHQFGLDHGVFNPLQPSTGITIQEYTAKAMGVMTSGIEDPNSKYVYLINRHCNLIRTRIGSPSEQL